MPVLFFAVFCFASFGWAMAGHFRPSGRPPGITFVTAALGAIFTGQHLWALYEGPVRLPGSGTLLYCASAVLFWWAIRVTRGRGFGVIHQAHCPQSIVAAGPYRMIRHPFYASYLLAWIAGFVATASPALALAAPMMGALYLHAALREEKEFSAGALAADYRGYMRATGRFLPTLWPRR